MEFSVKSGHAEKQRTACIVAAVFEARRLSPIAEHLDKISNAYISTLLRRGDLEGKSGQTLLLHNVPGTSADRVLLIGCGKERELGDAQFREIIAKSIHVLNETGSMEAVSYLTEINVKNRDMHWKVKHAIESARDALYHFDEFKSKKDSLRRPLRRMIFMVPTRRELPIGELAIKEGLAIAEGVELTKNLGNTPANICTPSYLADRAEALAKQHPKISAAILEAKDMKALGMGSLLSVTQGSPLPPKLITLSYRGARKKEAKPIVLVGKGITFDTGGNSLKPPSSMIGMKYDMCGAASIMGAIHAAATLGLPLNIIGVLPSCENIPGGAATRPDDIVKTMSGLTVEIANTDAEGRLILCDALTYSERFDPEVVIDVATLTGACIIALGSHASALMSNHNPLANDLIQAGQMSGDRVWQMPIWDEYQAQLKSSSADLCNIGGSEAGSITAACFLANFTKKFHWAHLDIAGTATKGSGDKKGATGRPVPLLVQYLIDKSQAKK